MKSRPSTDRFTETEKVIASNNLKTKEIDDPKQIIVKKILELKDGTRAPIPIEFINLAKNKRLEKIREDDSEFTQLVRSIEEVGVLHAPLITILDGDIVPLGGHRRIAAVRYLQHQTIVCEIKHFKESSKNTLAAMVENTARKNWKVVAIAKSIKELNQQGYEINKIADLLGKNRQTIGRLLKVAGWNHEILDLIQNNSEKLNMMAVLSVANKTLNEKEVLAKFKKILGENKVDRQAEKFAQNLDKANNFIKERKLNDAQKNLVIDALKEFGLLK